MEEITIMDYENNKTTITIPNMNNVYFISISVYSGDEVLCIVRDNGDVEEFDSCSTGRYASYFDGRYQLYNRPKGINHLHDDKFLNRQNSYSYFVSWYRDNAD